ncbi:hypothetical protein ACQEVI_06165 [Promicromonospora sp. CA-289599]|uniref:hypothetical protein n=1 Tax=Promicromonospora sp. CA-289599 TaxID=3240014 RepID=UPI003D89BBD4
MSSLDQESFRFPRERKIIVVTGREDDAAAWSDLIGEDRCLAVPLDAAPAEVVRPLLGASDQLAWQHSVLATIDETGWLAEQVASFDPSGVAPLLLPDPLDPVRAGRRRRLGVRPRSVSAFEDKTVVDSLWDAIGIARASSVVIDGVHDLVDIGKRVDQGHGVVCSVQPIGASPSAGGDGIWWWRDDVPPRLNVHDCRVRVMPLLPGAPVRLHGLVTREQFVGFPPMEIVTLPRLDRGTFLCTGSVTSSVLDPTLHELTGMIGTGLRERLDYRGAFSVDGILTTRGFVPTDLNTRLTSAMESTPSDLRVRLHAANLLARHDGELDHDRTALLARTVFDRGNVHTLYGAAHRAHPDAPTSAHGRWEGRKLRSSTERSSDVSLRLTHSARGWLLTAKLTVTGLPATDQIGNLAPAIFAYCDEVFGTDFGNLAPPFSVE